MPHLVTPPKMITGMSELIITIPFLSMLPHENSVHRHCRESPLRTQGIMLS